MPELGKSLSLYEMCGTEVGATGFGCERPRGHSPMDLDNAGSHRSDPTPEDEMRIAAGNPHVASPIEMAPAGVDWKASYDALIGDGAGRPVCTCTPDHPCYLHAGDLEDPAERLRKVTEALRAARDSATPDELARATGIGELLGRPGAIVIGQDGLERLRAALGEHDGAIAGMKRTAETIALPIFPAPTTSGGCGGRLDDAELDEWRETYGAEARGKVRDASGSYVDLSLPPLPSRATVLGLLGAIAGVILAGRRLRRASRNAKRVPPGAATLADLIGTGR